MKRIKWFLILWACLLPFMAQAGRVTEQQALQRAQQFMRQQGGQVAALQGKSFTRVSRHQAPGIVTDAPYYVFNAEQRGYVIASADDRTVPVLAYSLTGTLDLDNLPENIQSWLDGYADQLEWLNEHPQAAPAAKTLSAPAIPTMLVTTWNQGDPYSLLTPSYQTTDDDDNVITLHCVTGCVATAMAQVMYYHQWPAQTTIEIPGYTTKRGDAVASVAAGTTIKWGDMLPSYKNVTATDDQKLAVAQLMLMCGTSVQMEYTPKSSGAATAEVADALKAYFDYDASTTHLDRLDYKIAQWNQLVYDELAAGRPVVYHGQSSGGGHAFVIDGYDTDDYFHVNWGWGGGSNGYFLLSILDPGSNSGIGASSSTDGYSFSQGAIVGIQKNTGVIPEEIVVLQSYGDTELLNGSDFVRSDVSDNFSAQVKFRYWNTTDGYTEFDYGVGFFNESGQMLSIAASTTSANPINLTYIRNYSTTVSFGSDIINGTYYLKAISRLHGTDTWGVNYNADQFAIKAVINGNNVTLSLPAKPVLDLSATLTQVTAEPKVQKKCVMNCSFTNNGTDFNDEVYFLLDGNRVGGRVFELDAGQTGDLTFSFIPEDAGTKTVAVALQQYNSSTNTWEYNTLASCQVTIGEAPEAKLSIAMEVTNATGSVVNTNYANVKATLTNEMTTEYDDDILIEKWVKNGGYRYYVSSQYVPVVVAGSGTTTVDFTVEDFENGTYYLYAYYKSQGTWIEMSPRCVLNIELLPTIVLDETATTAPDASGTAVNVTVNRTINAGEWSTICLPFDMSETQVKAVFGNDVLLKELKSWSFTGDPTAATSISLGFGNATSIQKNCPYLIKVATALTSFSVDGVTIDPVATPATAAVAYTVGSDTYNAYMHGYYTQSTVPQYGMFMAGGSKLYYSIGKTKIMGFRASLAFEGVKLASYGTTAPARVTITFDDETTGIGEVMEQTVDDAFYNLRGQRVTNPGKGVYIKNGKKVYIK